MSILEEKLNNVSDRLDLAPDEYAGPLVIDRPITLDGHNSTIWANTGPVLVVDSCSVCLKNLRIELSGSNNDEDVAFKLNASDTVLENVEVNGRVLGLPGELPDVRVPSVIAVGDFAANKENSFSVEIEVPAAAEIQHSITGVEIFPPKLRKGKNTLTIKIAAMRDNTILFGEILLKSKVFRRIYLMGKSMKGADEHHAELPVSGSLPISKTVQIETPEEVIAPLIPEDGSVMIARKGQRVSAKELSACKLKIVCEHSTGERIIDLDPYVFLLGKNGKARTDNDLIFFGNSTSENSCVRVSSQNMQALATIQLNEIEPDIEKIAVAYSIYDELDSVDFSGVVNPIIRVLADEKEKYRLPLADLSTEKTLVAIEIYRYKGEWKINFVGAGYGAGLSRLCNEYGIDVE